jgi:hypothetical protein
LEYFSVYQSVEPDLVFVFSQENGTTPTAHPDIEGMLSVITKVISHITWSYLLLNNDERIYNAFGGKLMYINLTLCGPYKTIYIYGYIWPTRQDFYYPTGQVFYIPPYPTISKYIYIYIYRMSIKLAQISL